MGTVDRAWQARMKPFALSSGVRPFCTAIVTDPDSSFTLHTPQTPARQTVGMATPRPSAASRTVRSGGSGADLPALVKVTSGVGAGGGGGAAAACETARAPPTAAPATEALDVSRLS